MDLEGHICWRGGGGGGGAEFEFSKWEASHEGIGLFLWGNLTPQDTM